MPGRKIDVIDSHTGGEPTRVVLHGAPALDASSAADALAKLRARHHGFRRALIDEPRGSDILVGALLLPAFDPASVATILFFNNVDFFAMCGHGTIGVAVTMAHEGTLQPGEHQFDTAAGPIKVTLRDAHRVSLQNVPSYRLQRAARLEVPDIGTVRGDIAWGGNWFFLVTEHEQRIHPDNIPALTRFTARIRQALDTSELRGAQGALIDHIELCGPPSDPQLADSRNFVLCPGNAYDRSPCGTGTSAHIACLIADGHLEPGQPWRQQSITGSIFEASGEICDNGIVPTITGDAFLTARATLLFDEQDPLARSFAAE